MKFELSEHEVRALIEVLGAAKGAFEYISTDAQYQQQFRDQAKEISKQSNEFASKLTIQFSQQTR